MELMISPNKCWCGPVSLAMLLGDSVESIIKDIGHDGLEMRFPNQKEPNCWKGFHHQELIDVCWHRGRYLGYIEAVPQYWYPWEKEATFHYGTDYDYDKRLLDYMVGIPGIIIGMVAADKGHAVAWDGNQVYDPGPEKARVYRFANDAECIQISSFLPLWR